MIVIGIGWRCTPSGHEPCHMLFNLSDHLLHTPNTRDRHLRRLRHHNTDQNQWFGGILKHLLMFYLIFILSYACNIESHVKIKAFEFFTSLWENVCMVFIDLLVCIVIL